MFSQRTAGLLFLLMVGLLLMPAIGLPYTSMDWSAYSAAYDADTPTPTFTLSPPATGTATTTLTSTATATATSTATGTPPATSTATATSTVTPTMTPTSGTGHIGGRVQVQGRFNARGVRIDVDGTPAATTTSNGDFDASGVPQGTHVVRAWLQGYLPAEKADVSVTIGQTTILSPVQLRGGDVDGDNEVGLLDLVIVASNYYVTPPDDPRADINADGEVDLFDLVLVAGNYRLTGPLQWP